MYQSQKNAKVLASEVDAALRIAKLHASIAGDNPHLGEPSASCVSETVLHADYEAMKVPGFIGMSEIASDANYESDLSCDDITYSPEDPRRIIEHSKSRILPDDFQFLNEYLRETGYGALISGKDVDLNDVDFKSLPDWYRFTGSSVWLPEQECHLMASRLVYSPNKIPVLSLVRLQIYDADWNEMKGRRLRYTDVSDDELSKALVSYTGSGEESTLDSVTIKFPTILDIDLDESSRSDLLGPEDPRITVRSNGEIHEPVVVFNQDYRGRRTMYATFPLRKTAPGMKKKTIQLRKALMGEWPFEKNWTPFFDNMAPKTLDSSGYMYMFYSLDPLRILKCNLDTGDCDTVQETGKTTHIDRGGSLTSVRGATSLRAVPRHIVQRMLRRENVLDPDYPLQMWVGFVKTHIDDCGCGHMIYRPTLMVLVKQDNSFRVDLMTGSMDFGKDVMAWNDHSSIYCDDGNNVMNPNEISFWDIGEEEPIQASKFDPDSKELPLYKDYMALTLSEADENVEVIFLRNVLNYILGSYERSRLVLSDKDVFSAVQDRTTKVETCMLQSSLKYCEEYAESHKRPDEGVSLVDELPKEDNPDEEINLEDLPKADDYPDAEDFNLNDVREKEDADEPAVESGDLNIEDPAREEE
ncbi:DEKNAAC102149 [Brettanomyces naardenensis]|uniref:DEKNAAC102149 n=1 Tax=Brettanomyces naardenensis TaxID=13370 RepID=A0A448YK39_BRENA|nr:DEKNAAC102149 [Brettanomyces naardenensis]